MGAERFRFEFAFGALVHDAAKLPLDWKCVDVGFDEEDARIWNVSSIAGAPVDPAIEEVVVYGVTLAANASAISPATSLPSLTSICWLLKNAPVARLFFPTEMPF